MAFRFPLAAVLKVRESVEKREERALQRILLEIAQMLRRIEELGEQIAKAHAAREHALRQPIPASHLQSLLWEAEAAAAQKTSMLNSLKQLEQRRDEQMKIYSAAHRDHETILNIQHEQRDAYEQERARTEQKYLDDIFMARRHRS